MATPSMDVLEMFNQVGVLVDSATTGQQQPRGRQLPHQRQILFRWKVGK
jgi:hypothetical protein